jgi:hypothetical protein
MSRVKIATKYSKSCSCDELIYARLVAIFAQVNKKDS